MSYSLMMEGRSVEDLHDYINNYQKYWPDAIEAAVAELKNRGEVFTLEEQAEIEKRIEIRRQAAKEMELQEPPARTLWEEVPLKENEPELYSQVAIVAFTLFFSLIVGGILMSANLKRLGKKKGRTLVILFTVACVMIEIVLFLLLGANGIIPIIFNVCASLIFALLFWKKYIGEQHYSSKSVVKPLLIFLLIFFAMYLLTVLMIKASGIDPQQLMPK